MEFANGEFQINTADGLYAFANFVNNTTSTTETAKSSDVKILDGTTQTTMAAFETSNGSIARQSASATLTANIDLSTTTLSNAAWTPIGTNVGTQYQGTFDGAGYYVSNITSVTSGMVSGSSHYDSDYYSIQGFFGILQGATVKNLGVKGVIMGSAYVGGIAGMAYDSAVIYNCYNECEIICRADASYGYGYCTGGIVGFIGYLSSWGGIYEGEDDSSYSYKNAAATNVTIENCYNVGNVTGLEVGGIVGTTITYAQFNIKNCYSYATLADNNSSPLSSTHSGRIGGIVGSVQATVSSLGRTRNILYCYYRDDTTALVGDYASGYATSDDTVNYTGSESMTAASMTELAFATTLNNNITTIQSSNNLASWTSSSSTPVLVYND